MENHSALETIFLCLELMSGFISTLIHSKNTHTQKKSTFSTV